MLFISRPLRFPSRRRRYGAPPLRAKWLRSLMLATLPAVLLGEMQQAPPSSAPQRLTIHPVEGNPDAVRLNWEAPSEPQGEITGYLIFYKPKDPSSVPPQNSGESSSKSAQEAAAAAKPLGGGAIPSGALPGGRGLPLGGSSASWTVEGVYADTLSLVVRNLYQDATYFFKVRARNSGGYGPESDTVVYTLQSGSDGGSSGGSSTLVRPGPGAPPGLTPGLRGHMGQRSAMMTASLEKIPLRVVSILEPPFLMLEGEGLSGNHRFRGYIKDLLEKLSQYLDRPYMLYLVPDGKYGSEIGHSEWNGIIGQLLKNKADLAAAPLTITMTRERIVDFTKPFLSTGVTFLYKPPSIPSTTWDRQLLGVFALELWLLIGASFFITAIALMFLQRFSPFNLGPDRELSATHVGRPPSRSSSRANGILHDSKTRPEHHLGLLDCLWMLVSGISPKGMSQSTVSSSVRVLLISWWFFCVVVVVFLTAGASTRLLFNVTTQGGQGSATIIPNVHSLVHKRILKYGTLQFGSTHNFFRRSHSSLYESMYDRMVDNPELFVGSVSEGVQRALREPFAFFLERVMADYSASRHCELVVHPGDINMIAYGLATPQNSSLRDALSLALLQLQENGYLQSLYRKWFTGGGHCGGGGETASDVTVSASAFAAESSISPHLLNHPNNLFSSSNKGPANVQISLNDVYTAFLIPLVGLILSLVTFVVEVVLHRVYGFGPRDPETPLGVGGPVPGSGVAGSGGGGGAGGGGGTYYPRGHHEPTCPTSCSTHSTSGGLVGIGAAGSSIHAAAGGHHSGSHYGIPSNRGGSRSSGTGSHHDDKAMV